MISVIILLLKGVAGLLVIDYLCLYTTWPAVGVVGMFE